MCLKWVRPGRILIPRWSAISDGECFLQKIKKAMPPLAGHIKLAYTNYNIQVIDIN